MDKYIPDDKTVRAAYVLHANGHDLGESHDEFDRWLVEHDARVVREAEQSRSDANWALYIDRQGGS